MPNSLKPPYGDIFEGLEAGMIIPFLGAGASLGARSPATTKFELRAGFPTPPTGAELADILAEKCSFPEGETRDLAKVAQYSSVSSGPDNLLLNLHRVFDSDYSVTSLHTFLATRPRPLLIVTTNYDDLIERAFDENRRPYEVVIQAIELKGLLWRKHDQKEPTQVSSKQLTANMLAAKTLASTTVIYKMHGGIDRMVKERDQYVITEDDYIDFLSEMNTAIPLVFKNAFSERHFLFLGYGLYDWNLRVVWSQIQKQARRARIEPSWAIQLNPRPLEQRLWEKRGVDVYDLGLDEFVRTLKKSDPQESRNATSPAPTSPTPTLPADMFYPPPPVPQLASAHAP